MAAGLSCVLCLLCVVLVPAVFAGGECAAFTDDESTYHSSQRCYISDYCCGSCDNRYCCDDFHRRLSQDDCFQGFFNGDLPDSVSIGAGVASLVILVLLFICCCVCPCCCIYKMCRKPRPVIATTTHTTVVTGLPASYPQQATASAGPQSYQGAQYLAYQPVPVQPQAYGGPSVPTAPYHGPPYTPGPPPPYQEASGPGPGYPPAPVPYSQAAFSPGQPAYSLQPPAQPSEPDYLAQPAYNPAYAHPPPKPGY